MGSGLDYLLRNSGNNLHLVILGRTDPLLPLHKYRLEKTITEIRLADLAFTKAEAQVMLAGLGVELRPALVGDLISSDTRLGGGAAIRGDDVGPSI